MSAIPVMVLAALLLAPSQRPVTITPQETAEARELETGSCSDGKLYYDLSKFRHNRRDQITITDKQRYKLKISKDRLSITPLSGKDAETTTVYKMGHVVAKEGEERADVFINFGKFDSRTALYWRETYQNRMHRQGVFYFAGVDLVRLCEGMGGTESSH